MVKMREAGASLLLTVDVTDWPRSAQQELMAAAAEIRGRALRPRSEAEAQHGWTKVLLTKLIGYLTVSGYYAQAHTLDELLAGSPTVSRERVYELGEYPPERSLKGFTRPVNRIVGEMKTRNEIPEDAPVPLEPIYDENVRGYQQAKGFRLADQRLADLFLADGES